MNFQTHPFRWTASVMVLAMLVLSSCNRGGNEPAATTNPTTTAATTAPAPSPAATTTAASAAGVPPQGTNCPSNAPVKGVDTQKRGKIYHAPTYPDYKTVKPTICFPDAAAAEKAGYKLPQAK